MMTSHDEYLAICDFVDGVVENTRGKPSSVVLKKHLMLREVKRKLAGDFESPQMLERRTKRLAGGFRTVSQDPLEDLVTFSPANNQGLGVVNALAALARPPEVTNPTKDCGAAGLQKTAIPSKNLDVAKDPRGDAPVDMEGSPENDKGSENEVDSSDSGTGSSSKSGPGKSDAEGDSEVEVHDGSSLAMITADMEVDQSLSMKLAETPLKVVAMEVEKAPSQVAVTGATPGAIFDPPCLTSDPGYMLVGGFSVLAKYEALYTRIWRKHGHMATTKKVTSRISLVKRVEEALSSIEDMCNVTGFTISEDVIDNWEDHRDVCVGKEFNFSWFFENLAEVRKLKDAAVGSLSIEEIMRLEEEANQLSKKLSEKRAIIANARDRLAKRSELLLKDFP